MDRGSCVIGYLAGLLALPAPPAACAVCTITGDATIDCDGIAYRAVDEESIHYVDLAQHNAAHPAIPLPTLLKTVAGNYAAHAVPEPVVVALTDYVDCTGTTHNFSDANIVPSVDVPLPGNPFNTNPHPNKPSRLMNISGKTFRVTAAPDDGFATYYYSYDLATGGTAGVPHLLVAESSNDRERYTDLAIQHHDPVLFGSQLATPPFPSTTWAPPYQSEPTTDPWGGGETYDRTQDGRIFGPDVGLAVYTGRELPVDHQPFNITLIFHPKQTAVRVVVSTQGTYVTRTSSDGAAVSQMWCFRFVNPMPATPVPQRLPRHAGDRRLIGIHMTHPWYFYGHFGTPARLLEHRQAGLQRLVEHLAHCGFNYVVFNAINGADRSERAWYEGSAYFDWNAAGDLLSELPPIAQASGIQVVPLITSVLPSGTNGLAVPAEARQIGSDGDIVRAFGSPALDPLHPATQSIITTLLSEIASRTASAPAVRGIGIRVNGKFGTCYATDEVNWESARKSGYSPFDLQSFKNATGSAVPVSPPGTAYTWLTARPAEWESWLNWRCRRTREFWLACRDLIRSYRSDWIFYVQCDLPAEQTATNVEWASGETPYNLLRYHGYDPHLFENDTGIVIARGMMVAEDRYYVNSRWGPPLGTNYENYRLFHFAPGLAELYRTAQGRAVDFYQCYWEETRHPYFEFGDPLNPFGYFRTSTPAAFGRHFFAPATMSLRRQDPDTMTWLGWNRPTLGHEIELRKFSQAFRALPAGTAAPFAGTVSPNLPDEIAARWHGDRLAVINDSATPRTITLSFASPHPEGHSLTDVVSGRVLIPLNGGNRSSASFAAEAYSLTTFVPAADLPVVPADFDDDADVDQTDFARFQLCISGEGIIQTDPDCALARLDADGDVDQADLSLFLACMSGPDKIGNPNCLD